MPWHSNFPRTLVDLRQDDATRSHVIAGQAAIFQSHVIAAQAGI